MRDCLNDWLTDWQLINLEIRSTDWKSNRLICLLFNRLTDWLPGTLNKWMTNLLPGNWMTDCTAHWQTDEPTEQSIENWLNPLYIDLKTPWQRAVKLSLYKSNQLENPRVFLFSCFLIEYNFSWLWRRFRFKMSWVLFRCYMKRNKIFQSTAASSISRKKFAPNHKLAIRGIPLRKYVILNNR